MENECESLIGIFATIDGMMILTRVLKRLKQHELLDMVTKFCNTQKQEISRLSLHFM